MILQIAYREDMSVHSNFVNVLLGRYESYKLLNKPVLTLSALKHGQKPLRILTIGTKALVNPVVTSDSPFGSALRSKWHTHTSV